MSDKPQSQTTEPVEAMDTTPKRVDQTAAQSTILKSPSLFRRWWELRREPNDREIVAEAERAGLITKAAGLIFLTAKGKELRHGR